MASKKQLVCQHWENISRKAFEAIIRQYVRHRQGVYALYRRNKLYADNNGPAYTYGLCR